MKKARPTCLYVEWLDHGCSSGWARTSEVCMEPLICKSVGWVIKESKDQIVLGATVQTNGIDTSAVRTHLLKRDIIKKVTLK